MGNSYCNVHKIAWFVQVSIVISSKLYFMRFGPRSSFFNSRYLHKYPRNFEISHSHNKISKVLNFPNTIVVQNYISTDSITDVSGPHLNSDSIILMICFQAVTTHPIKLWSYRKQWLTSLRSLLICVKEPNLHIQIYCIIHSEAIYHMNLTDFWVGGRFFKSLWFCGFKQIGVSW